MALYSKKPSQLPRCQRLISQVTCANSLQEGLMRADIEKANKIVRAAGIKPE
jgi:hypothetical protein